MLTQREHETQKPATEANSPPRLVQDDIRRDPTVRIAGSWRLSVRASRLLYTGLFGVGSLAALLSARMSLASHPFSQGVVPILLGALVGLMVHPSLHLSEREDEPMHVPDVLAHMGGVLFVGILLARFLPPWTSGAWIGFAGGVALLCALLLHNDTRRSRERHMASLGAVDSPVGALEANATDHDQAT